MGMVIIEDGAALGVNLWRPIVTNLDVDALFLTYFVEDLFYMCGRLWSHGIRTG